MQQALCNIIIGNHAIPQRANCSNGARRASKHAARFLANCQDAARDLFHSHNRRLAQHDTFSAHINQNACRAKIDTDIIELKKPHIATPFKRKRSHKNRGVSTQRTIPRIIPNYCIILS